MLKKYDNRALMVVNGTCAIHCRYCFRREFPYHDQQLQSAWKESLNKIAADSTVEEIILSGGDPLTSVDQQFSTLVKRIDEIPHIRRIRIHTRLPIMIPQRLTPELLECLCELRSKVVCVIHCNHANEIDSEVSRAVLRLITAGVVMLNQSVLLRGVNDSIKALIHLSEKLVDTGVTPYYLHHLDPVRGAQHFEVPVAEGIALVEKNACECLWISRSKIRPRNSRPPIQTPLA